MIFVSNSADCRSSFMTPSDHQFTIIFEFMKCIESCHFEIILHIELIFVSHNYLMDKSETFKNYIPIQFSLNNFKMQ